MSTALDERVETSIDWDALMSEAVACEIQCHNDHPQHGGDAKWYAISHCGQVAAWCDPVKVHIEAVFKKDIGGMCSLCGTRFRYLRDAVRFEPIG